MKDYVVGLLALVSMVAIVVSCAMAIHQHAPWPGNIFLYGLLGLAVATFIDRRGGQGKK